jgi:copper transport protein
LAVATVAVMGQARVAAAHAALVRSDPAASATVAEPPSAIRLWFKEPVVVEATDVEVETAEGAAVDTGLRTQPGQPDLVVVDLPASVRDGVYVVRWRVLSDADGHVTRGVLAFGVGDGADPSTVVLDPPDAAVPQDVVLRWMNFLATCAVLGPLAVTLAVLGRHRCRASPELNVARRTAQARLLGGAVVAVGVTGALGVATAASDIHSLTSGSGGSDTTAAELLFGTRWGLLSLSRQLVLVLAAGCLILLRRSLDDPRTGRAARNVAAGAAVASGVALAVIQALSGHAAAVDTAPALAVAADAAHLIAAACWTGGMVALLSLGGLRRAEPAGMLAREAWRSFGLLAALCVAVLALTGVYGMAGEVASLDAALTTTYGRALLGKSALFVAMGLVGLCSSAALHPAVARRLDAMLGRLARRLPGPCQVRRLVMVESALGVTILLLAALASASPPANGPEFSPAASAAPATRSGTVEDMLVSLSAYPNRPGENLLRVRATSTRRQAADEIALVLARFATGREGDPVETVPLTAAGDGTYEAMTTVIARAGLWRTEVVVRRAGVEDATVAFDWEVPVATPRPRLISDAPWRGWLEAAVVALLFAEVVTLALFVRRTRAVPRRAARDELRVPVRSSAGGAHR